MTRRCLKGIQTDFKTGLALYAGLGRFDRDASWKVQCHFVNLPFSGVTLHKQLNKP
jgi:hypothetical protein